MHGVSPNFIKVGGPQGEGPCRLTPVPNPAFPPLPPRTRSFPSSPPQVDALKAAQMESGQAVFSLPPTSPPTHFPLSPNQVGALKAAQMESGRRAEAFDKGVYFIGKVRGMRGGET